MADVPLIEKLETHFNAAAKQYPQAAAFFTMSVEALRAAFDGRMRPEEYFLASAVAESKRPETIAFQASPEAEAVYAGSRAIIKAHKGPLI